MTEDILDNLHCSTCGSHAIVSDLPDGSLRVICPICYSCDIFKADS